MPQHALRFGRASACARAPLVFALALLTMVFLFAQRSAAQVLLLDGNAAVAFSPSTGASQDNVNLVWNGIDYANQIWWWYREAGDGMETRLPPPDLQTSTTNTAQWTWTNVNGGGFDYELDLAVYDCNVSAAACGLADDVMVFVMERRFTNRSGAQGDWALFEYVDLDINGSLNDEAEVVNGLGDDIYRIRDGAREVLWATWAGSNVQAATYPLLRNELEDANKDDLIPDLAGLPFGPGDVTLAAEILLAPPDGSTYSRQTAFIVRDSLFSDGFESGDTSAWQP